MPPRAKGQTLRALPKRQRTNTHNNNDDDDDDDNDNNDNNIDKWFPFLKCDNSLASWSATAAPRL